MQYFRHQTKYIGK